jgi:uncharacterized phage protein gp47/JayE
MARIRSQNEIILSLLDFLRTAQPNLDTKPGTVSRDILVDAPSSQISRLYQELQRITSLQSLRLAVGSDLDKLAANYNQVRKSGTRSSGPALLTFKTLDIDVAINKGTVVSAKNGATFIIKTGIVVSPVFANAYRATASQYRAELDLANISDLYAVEVLVESSITGLQGNISKYSLSNISISGVSNITNVVPFSGGTLSEDDATFRSRLLAIFSGANTGTSLGYKNAVLQDPAALDAVVVEPGNPLMTRDGTQVVTNPDTGESIIVSEGAGGKVDVYTYGTKLQEIIESFIYIDKSNTGSAANSNNDYVIGQIAVDYGKTITKKRLDNVSSGIYPNQPVNNLVEVSGSVSGSNFTEKSVDFYGRVSGNYELLKDDGDYAGSVWGFDKLRWISDKISDLSEDKTKSTYNGQDPLTYTNITGISKCRQRIGVVNENSTVNKIYRNSIQLAHKPITNVTRVFNVTTGERYIVANQNPDGNSDFNETGRILISGSSLPSVSDTLQIDYTWIKTYDSYIDFDGLLSNINPNPRDVSDSVDWGYSNAVRREESTLTTQGSVLVSEVTHPVSTVISVNTTQKDSSVITLINGRPAIVVPQVVSNVVSIVRTIDGADVWNTSIADGTFTGYTIFLPTDGLGDNGQAVDITYNAVDVFNADGYNGSYDGNIITIVPSSEAVAGYVVEVNYISNVKTLLPATVIANLPAKKSGNYFNTEVLSNIGSQPTTSTSSGDKNLRQAPSNLQLTVAGSVSPGIFTITGTTMVKVTDAVFTVAPQYNQELTVNLGIPIRSALGLKSTDSIPSNLKVARVVSFEKVQATSDGEVISVDQSYDIKGYILRDNTFFKSESVQDSITIAQPKGRNLLGYSEFRLSDTTTNEESAPNVGDKVRITFYFVLEKDIENVSFSKSGTLYTDKIFATVDSIIVSSGFTSGASQAATLTVNNLNQPNTGNRYQSMYDYLAPKQNERITLRYNLNKLISDSQGLIELTKPITADVLGKEATRIGIDVEMNIVLFSEYVNSKNTVSQNVKDAITAALNANNLGTTIDASDLVVVAQGIDGVDRARVMYFSKMSNGGNVLSITASDNQYLRANEVTINIETR